MNRAPLASIPVEQVEWLEVVTGGRRWKPYPEYRESNIEWLGRVPVGWTIDRLKWTTAGSRNGIWGSEPDAQNDIICVRVADFDRTGFSVWIDDPTVRAVLPNERRGRVLQRGDLLIEKSGGGDLQPVGVVVQFDHDEPAVCSNFVARVLVPPAFDSRYLVYLHAHLYAGRVNTRSIKQTTGIQNLDATAYFDEGVAWPPLPEQRAIAAFLDGKTRQIDELIKKKRRLIELLHEKRTALISHAVTKGLDPAAPMKPSGIDWLGDVPVHWEVKPLKFLTSRIGSGKTPKGGAEVYVSEGVMLLRSQNVYDDGLRLDDVVFIDEETDAEMAGTRVQPGDVLLNITGASIGRAAVVPPGAPRANVNQHVCIIRPAKVSARFLHAFFCSKAVKDWIRAEENGTSREGLNFRQIGSMDLPVPPPAEQDAITRAIEQATQKADGIRRAAHDAIDRLAEYRQAMISAAVTGKIDVREEGAEA